MKTAASKRREIQVWAQWLDMGSPECVGLLTATTGRGKEIFSFSYQDAWLRNPHARVFDPSLRDFAGAQFAAATDGNFGAFLDSSPDRWGRRLMRRREALAAREERRTERTLRESDYLLGVFDAHRSGALRFKLESNGPFLDDDRAHAAPPWTSLRDLEHASLGLERDDAEDAAEYAKWLRLLIAPGGSLGGARPKAGVVDDAGALWIAKFPSRRDGPDVGAWEHVVATLAKRAGVVMAPSIIRRFGSRHHTFLTRRFDRQGARGRVHFASGMTMLGRRDGDDATSGASYLDLARVLIQNGSLPAEDLEQLWTRIVFNVCVSNVDDHLRNHGFLLDVGGWRLSPAFDVNPDAEGDGLKLNISETDNAQDLALVLETAPQFRVKAKRAAAIVRTVVGAARTWREVSAALGLSRSEQHEMAPAFRVADAASSLA